jgi:hypothetical protein
MVTVRGSGLDLEGGRVIFENSVEVSRDSELVQAWSDAEVVFRVPTPAAGAFEIVGQGDIVRAGSFLPEPWRPAALTGESEQRQRLDWTKVDADTIVEALWAEGALQIHFIERDGTRTVHALDARATSVVLVPMGAGSVEGYFFDAEEQEEIGWLAATRQGAEFRIAELEDDVDALLAVDRDERGSYVWLSDSDHELLLQWRVEGGDFVEALVVDDPAPPASDRRIGAARGEHFWRVWVSDEVGAVDNKVPLPDYYFSVQGAYLAPGAIALTEARELGSADDSAYLLATHGVTLDGAVAVEFCGANEELRSTERTCGSLIADSEGIVHKDQDLLSAERTLYYAFDDGPAALECVDGVQQLIRHDRPDPTPDPVFAPCEVEAPPHELDVAGAPSFAAFTPGGRVVLSRD